MTKWFRCVIITNIKKINNLYLTEYIALYNQHAKRMRRIILSCVVCLSHKRHNLYKETFKQKNFLIFLLISSQKFLFVAEISYTYVCLYYIHITFVRIWQNIKVSLHFQVLNYHFLLNPLNVDRVVPCVRTDRHPSRN